MATLQIGFAREDFTPDKPVIMNSVLTGTVIREPICVTALSLREGERRVLILQLDVRNIYKHFTDVALPIISEATGVPEDAIFMHSPHNHSSPDMSAAEDPTVLDWRDRIGMPAILRAAIAAIAEEHAVTGMAGGRSHTERTNYVRRYRRADGSWNGITSKGSSSPIVEHESFADPELRAVRITREGAKDIVLVSYQVHAAGALGQHRDAINPDFLGVLRNKLEETENCHALYLQGACGNLNYYTSVPAEKPFLIKTYEEVGSAIADFALQALSHMKPLRYEGLQYRRWVLNAPVNHSTDHKLEAALAASAETDPEKLEKILNDADIPTHYQLPAIIKRCGLGETAPMELGAVSFGDLAMAFNPVEMFDINGIQLRENSPFAMTFPCSYSLNYWGYMPSYQMYPHNLYEDQMCHFLPGTGETIVLELCAELNNMKKNPQ